MRSIRLLKLLILLVAGVCLLSFPVLSGENPWDADQGRDGTDELLPPIDSTHVIDLNDDFEGLTLVSGNLSWYDDFIISTTIYLYEWYYGESFDFSRKQVVQGRGSSPKDR